MSLGDRLQPLIGWLTLFVVLLSSIALGANRPVSWSLMSMAIMGLFALQVMIDMIRGFKPETVRFLVPAFFFLAAVIWAIVQVSNGMPESMLHPIWSLVETRGTISGDPGQGWHNIMRILVYGMVAWIAVRSCELRDMGFRYLSAIAIFSTLLALFGLAVLIWRNNPIVPDGVTHVVTATFVNRNSYATFAVIGLIANMAMYSRIMASIDGVDSRSRLRNFLEAFFEGTWKYALGFIACLGALLLSQSRAGAAAGLIAMLVFLTTYGLGRNTARPVILGTLGAIFAFVALNSSTGLVNRFLTTSDEGGRFLIYPQIVQAIQERPILGHGLGAFHDTFRSHVPPEAAHAEWDLAHSTYLENFYELGIPAAAAFYFALILIAVRLINGLATRRRDREFSAAAFAIMVAAGFHSLFDFSLQMPATAALFAWILGLGYVQSFSTQTTSKKKRRSSRSSQSDLPPSLPETSLRPAE